MRIEEDIKDDIEDAIEKVSLQGGSIEPENYYLYQDDKIEYLCYTNEFYLPCLVQRPMLKQHIENEIENAILEETQKCFQSLKISYEDQGYDVELREGALIVELIPDKVATTFNHELTITKGDSTNFDSFNIVVNNNIYDLISIANSIVSSESKYGDVETSIYMDYYHDLKVEKITRDDGSTIYILTNRDTEDKFQFASRSVAWPPGYGAV